MQRRATLKYAWLTLKHKLYVFQAGHRTGAPLWNLIAHDWHKFLPAELPHYGRQFFGAGDDPLGFSRAWQHHQKLGKHHPEYWVMVSGHSRGGYADGSALPMPERYVREMVADWLGAGRAYEGKFPASFAEWTWFHKNFARLNLHSDTRILAERIARESFGRRDLGEQGTVQTERACETCGRPADLNMRVCPACHEQHVSDEKAAIRS